MREDVLELENKLRKYKEDLNELKVKQPSAGDGWIVYRSITDNEWDINLSNVSASYDRLWKITHVPDDGDLTEGFAIYYYKTDYGIMSGLTFDSTYYDSREPYTYYLRIYGAGGPGSRLVMKFYVFSPKSGTLSITDMAP